jgi:DNA mismatch endonuclease, patch repair protein
VGRQRRDTGPAADDADSWVSTRASGRLRGRVGKDTGPEVMLRRRLHAAGLRYRLHPVLGQRLTADIAFPSARVVVFVDGCFWHGCPRHARWTPSGPNAERWARKFARNRERDAAATMLAEQQGLCPVRVWECEIREDVEGVVRQLSALVRGRREARRTGGQGDRGPRRRPAGPDTGSRMQARDRGPARSGGRPGGGPP